jgi:hypothetical protein
VTRPYVPSPADPVVLRHVYLGEPSHSRILTWRSPKQPSKGFKHALAFAFWSAGHEHPLWVCDPMLTDSALDSDETLASILWTIVTAGQCMLPHHAAMWARTPEAYALKLDLTVSDNYQDFTHLFHDIEGDL